MLSRRVSTDGRPDTPLKQADAKQCEPAKSSGVRTPCSESVSDGFPSSTNCPAVSSHGSGHWFDPSSVHSEVHNGFRPIGFPSRSGRCRAATTWQLRSPRSRGHRSSLWCRNAAVIGSGQRREGIHIRKTQRMTSLPTVPGRIRGGMLSDLSTGPVGPKPSARPTERHWRCRTRPADRHRSTRLVVACWLVAGFVHEGDFHFGAVLLHRAVLGERHIEFTDFGDAQMPK